MIWSIAFGILFGLILWHYVLPLFGFIITRKLFWQFVGFLFLGLVVLLIIVWASTSTKSKDISPINNTATDTSFNQNNNNTYTTPYLLQPNTETNTQTTNNSYDQVVPQHYKVTVLIFGTYNGSNSPKIIATDLANGKELDTSIYTNVSFNSPGDLMWVSCKPLFYGSVPSSMHSNSKDIDSVPGADGTGNYGLTLYSGMINDISFVCNNEN